MSFLDGLCFQSHDCMSYSDYANNVALYKGLGCAQVPMCTSSPCSCSSLGRLTRQGLLCPHSLLVIPGKNPGLGHCTCRVQKARGLAGGEVQKCAREGSPCSLCLTGSPCCVPTLGKAQLCLSTFLTGSPDISPTALCTCSHLHKHVVAPAADQGLVWHLASKVFIMASL